MLLLVKDPNGNKLNWLSLVSNYQNLVVYTFQSITQILSYIFQMTLKNVHHLFGLLWIVDIYF